MNDAPNYKRIWLQPFAGDEGSHTWCVHSVHDDDVEYVRADIALAAEERARKAEEEWNAGRLAIDELMDKHDDLVRVRHDLEFDLDTAEAKLAEAREALGESLPYLDAYCSSRHWDTDARALLERAALLAETTEGGSDA